MPRCGRWKVVALCLHFRDYGVVVSGTNEIGGAASVHRQGCTCLPRNISTTGAMTRNLGIGVGELGAASGLRLPHAHARQQPHRRRQQVQGPVSRHRLRDGKGVAQLGHARTGDVLPDAGQTCDWHGRVRPQHVHAPGNAVRSPLAPEPADDAQRHPGRRSRATSRSGDSSA